MSAYIHNDAHILAIVNSVRTHKLTPVTIDGIYCDVQLGPYADLVCKILKAENIRSVNERYSEDEPLFSGICFKPHKTLTIYGLYKAISSLDYQSCESSDWRETFACRLLDDWTSQIETITKHTADSIRKCKEYNAEHTWNAD